MHEGQSGSEVCLSSIWVGLPSTWAWFFMRVVQGKGMDRQDRNSRTPHGCPNRHRKKRKQCANCSQLLNLCFLQAIHSLLPNDPLDEIFTSLLEKPCLSSLWPCASTSAMFTNPKTFVVPLSLSCLFLGLPKGINARILTEEEYDQLPDEAPQFPGGPTSVIREVSEPSYDVN